MKNIISILAFVIFALTIFGVDANNGRSLKRCRNDLRRVQTKVNVLEKKANKCPVVFGPSDVAFIKNLPQDYCSIFRKGGSKQGELGQANGQQIFTGICSNTPQGEIPKVENMPSTLITFPENGAKIKIGCPFKVQVHSTNIEFGFFSDPVFTYNAFPQALNDKGQIKGHQHVTIQFLGDKKNKNPPNAQIFNFFKGLNDKSNNGKLETLVDVGLPKVGLYRICTILSSFSHQSVVL
ncbi:2798_t:CDS:1, partial [Funneliformis geosporum]